MCILFIHVNPEPQNGKYRLILAANRDEYYRRPATPASKDDQNIIGGKDMEPGREGGMWLGFSNKEQNNIKKHCAAALLNITGEVIQNPCGRGSIVADYLKTSLEFSDYVKLLEDGRNFNGYNLVAVEISTDGCHIYYHSNIPVIDTIYTGKHTLGFGNSPSFSPLAKISAGRNKFQEILDKNLKGNSLVNELLQLLKDKTCHLPDPELEKRAPNTYQYLCSNFISLEPPGYGTRTHTIILIDEDWNMEFIEHTMESPIDFENPKWIVSKIESKL